MTKYKVVLKDEGVLNTEYKADLISELKNGFITLLDQEDDIIAVFSPDQIIKIERISS